MKKTILLVSFSLLAFLSCANESSATSTMPDVSKPEAVQKFNLAIKKVAMEKEPAPTTPRTSAELSNYKKEMLLPAAKDLIASSGVSYSEIERQTGGDREKILKWAVEVYGDYNKQTNKNYKSEN